MSADGRRTRVLATRRGRPRRCRGSSRRRVMRMDEERRGHGVAASPHPAGGLATAPRRWWWSRATVATVLGGVAFPPTAKTPRGKGAARRDMAIGQAIEAPAYKIRRDGPSRRWGASTSRLPPQMALVDHLTEAISVHRGDERPGRRNLDLRPIPNLPPRPQPPSICHETTRSATRRGGGATSGQGLLALRGGAWRGP